MTKKKLKTQNLSTQLEVSSSKEENQNKSKLLSRKEYDVFELLKFSEDENTYIALGNNIVLSTESEEAAKKAIDKRDYKLLLNIVIASYEVINNLNK